MSYRIQKASQRGNKNPNGSTFICHLCGKNMANFRALQLHRLSKHSSEFYECQKCEEKFFGKSILFKHLEQVHKEVTILCKECGNIFSDEKTLRKHNRTFHGKFPCSHPNCKYQLNTLKNLKKHEDNHQADPAKFPCTECDKTHKTADLLRQHMETIHADNSCICNVEGCGSKFSHPKTLRQHQARFHEIEFRDQTTCKICGHYFKGSKRGLVDHMNSVHWLETFKAKFGKKEEDGEDDNELEVPIPPTKLCTTGAGFGRGGYTRN